MQHIILSWKFQTKENFKKIAWNHSSEIDFKYFMKLYIDHTKKPYSFLVNDTALTSANLLILRNNLL